MQSQLVCGGCRTVLLYPGGATSVRCAICDMVTPVPPAGMEMSQLICGGCGTLLMHARGATSVSCSCCHTVNLVPAVAPMPNDVAHVNCGNCRIMLMYAAGAPSVECSTCHYITNVNMDDTRSSLQVLQTVGNFLPASKPSTSSVSHLSYMCSALGMTIFPIVQGSRVKPEMERVRSCVIGFGFGDLKNPCSISGRVRRCGI